MQFTQFILYDQYCIILSYQRFLSSRKKMCSVEENSRKRAMNYYVPIQDDETLSFEKKKCNDILLERRAVRILSRRYALTATGYKYLEIGVNVGPPSYVEIAVGDNRGNVMILSLETWRRLYEKRWDIQKLLQSDHRDACSSISVGPLTVSACAINNVKLVRLENLNVRLMMTESTLFSMFNLDRCIYLAFEQLFENVGSVDAKFTQFSHIASTAADPKEVSNMIRVSDAFDKHQLVDCELLALVFST